MYKLDGKVIAITGGASGLGLEMAKLFTHVGAKVFVLDVNSPTEELDESIQYIQADVTNLSAMETIMHSIFDKTGRIDGIVNNAGITRDKSLGKMTEEMFDAVIAVNLKGVFNTTKAASPYLVGTKGSIVNISSVVGLYGNFGQTNYAAAKAAVIGMTKTWAKELGPKGVRSNAIAPGFIDTPMTAKMPADILSAMKEEVPLKRLGDPVDIANAALYLISDMGRYVNGAVLSVDGGLTL